MKPLSGMLKTGSPPPPKRRAVTIGFSPFFIASVAGVGNDSSMSSAQQAELARLVETGPDRAVGGVVRWRRVDLKRS